MSVVMYECEEVYIAEQVFLCAYVCNDDLSAELERIMNAVMYGCHDVYIAEQVFLGACVRIMMRNVHKKSAKEKLSRQSKNA